LSSPDRRPHLVIVGSGGRPYREYSFATLARKFRLSAVLSAEPTWQRPFLTSAAVTDLSDADAVAQAISTLTGDTLEIGVMTWDETVLEVTAQAAAKLCLPHMSPEAAAGCRDKYATRTAMAAAGLPSVRHRLVTTADDAVAFAAELGYPVVLKPRALAGSIGVVKAEDERSVRAAFTLATDAHFATLPTGHGVLVEEFLDGPEISVDSVVFNGTVHCVNVARKQLGFPPYFEEVGHLLTAWKDEPWADEVRDLVAGAHAALDVRHGVTHAEVRLTPAGPRLIELNGRLGGDLIPYAGELSNGIDLVAAAADIACGRMPDLRATRHRTVEVRFVYPEFDCAVERIDVTRAQSTPGIVHAAALAEPGTRLQLPPRAAIGRLVALVADGMDELDCATSLAMAESLLALEVVPVAG
jgi:biotin carboxylase